MLLKVRNIIFIVNNKYIIFHNFMNLSKMKLTHKIFFYHSASISLQTFSLCQPMVEGRTKWWLAKKNLKWD